jgi:hypothetical protein
VERLSAIAHLDWESSHPLNLTDEGLIAELEEHKIQAAKALALNGPIQKKKRRKP